MIKYSKQIGRSGIFSFYNNNNNNNNNFYIFTDGMFI